jgi:hypothetical protein
MASRPWLCRAFLVIWGRSHFGSTLATDLDAVLGQAAIVRRAFIAGGWRIFFQAALQLGGEVALLVLAQAPLPARFHGRDTTAGFAALDRVHLTACPRG